mmetsp:Transcript_61125/g.149640  ORF Transcript_61125/g.149640 Transcript_61125/m.149640 type:complete len:396 (+) Transcript_61125:304-1491(+)
MLSVVSSKVQALGPRFVRPFFSAVSARFGSSLAGLVGIQQQQQPTPCPRQHIVVALGGNALLRRGQKMTQQNQQENIATGIGSLGNIVRGNKVTLVHGNGPQVGLLLLEGAEYQSTTGLQAMSLDVLDAETEGMIGYMIEQELQKYLPPNRGMVTVLSQIVVDPNDPSMLNPTKFVGPIYKTQAEVEALGSPFKKDGDHYRRVVPSPVPIKLVDHQMEAVQRLTDSNCLVICAGGGGIPVVVDKRRDGGDGGASSAPEYYKGVEAVIDKDRAATMMGISLEADGLLILTDVPCVSLDYNTPQERRIKTASPSALVGLMDHFPAGSMGPKIEAATEFVNKTGGWAAIGSLKDAESILQGTSGTTISSKVLWNPEEDIHLEFYDDHEGWNEDERLHV